MIPIPPIALKIGAIALILGATYISGCVRGSEMANERIQRITEDYANFRINTEIVGKAAQRDADAIKASFVARKAASDESYSKALSVLGADLERLRKRANSSSHGLSAPPPSPTCPPEQRCFDREQFDSALREYEGEVLALVGEGSALKLRMDEAISWANRLNW